MNSQDYIRKLFAKEDRLRISISEILKESGVTAQSITPEVAKTLQLIVKISGAKNILEIGTLGGYSTICLAKATQGVGHVTSLEISPSL
ncbi:O-methyltransferase [Seinonella peptonophila]|uniref:O-methyltransferase n=1 Tax=Seinonella peptonophila TaxID=112248 RepID=A0A1M4ZXB5_9BACL|nr:hypothetical protein [Seinonella peptonophila]SHF22594.1 O-methyltransferase [Seinonella peptonophila]